MWGTNTELTAKDERLCNRFDYDGEYGTVLNRFLMQAMPCTMHHAPCTVHRAPCTVHRAMQCTVQCYAVPCSALCNATLCMLCNAM